MLANEDGKALLLSKYALDCQQYNAEFKSEATWETSTIRKWLNDGFINAAFSEKEKSMIQLTSVSAGVNSKYDSPVGNDTEDKVFLLSAAETEKYLSNNNARICSPTDFAISLCVRTSLLYKTAEGRKACGWWLRTPGNSSYFACNVSSYGYVSYYGSNYGIRPALWINL